MKTIKLALFFGLIFLSTVANAGVIYAGYSTVKRYYPVGGKTTFLLLDLAHINPAGCELTTYFAHHESYPEFEEYRKLILTAKASGQKIGVYIYDDECHGQYPKIYSMFIQ